jgi:hypothetical protein
MPSPLKLAGRPMTKIKARVRQSRELVSDKQQALKTTAMLLFELTHDKPIQILLTQGSGVEIASFLGITTACVSRWRKRFGIPVTYGGI